MAMKSFQQPDFSTGDVECRFQDGEVCIYGTPDGLRRFAALMVKVVTDCKPGESIHIHTEDYELLTRNSKHCAVAVFDVPKEHRGPTIG
jgi:hypothetical protein